MSRAIDTVLAYRTVMQRATIDNEINNKSERILMSRRTLKDAHFRAIGYVETAADGKQTGKDKQFRVVGYYDPRSNSTKDAHFRIVGYGNQLSSLIAMVRR
jgi:hypothetical protein